MGSILAGAISVGRMLVLSFLGVAAAFALVPVLDLSSAEALMLAGLAMLIAAYIAMAPVARQVPFTRGYLAIAAGLLSATTLAVTLKYGHSVMAESRNDPVTTSELIMTLSSAVVFGAMVVVILAKPGLPVVWRRTPSKTQSGVQGDSESKR